MAYDARAIANFFLDHAAIERQSITIMSLLKILYFAHAWYLAKTGRPLVGQPFEAWKYGPVSRVVYEQFKGAGARPLEGRAQVLNVSTAKFEIASYQHIDADTMELLRNTFNYYAYFHPFRLSDLTHEKDSPWDRVWIEASRRAVAGMVISDESIREWFQQSRSALVQAGTDRGDIDDQSAGPATSRPRPD
jgi:uncharacterized phage-associated protein